MLVVKHEIYKQFSISKKPLKLITNWSCSWNICNLANFLIGIAKQKAKDVNEVLMLFYGCKSINKFVLSFRGRYVRRSGQLYFFFCPVYHFWLNKCFSLYFFTLKKVHITDASNSLRVIAFKCYLAYPFYVINWIKYLPKICEICIIVAVYTRSLNDTYHHLNIVKHF